MDSNGNSNDFCPKGLQNAIAVVGMSCRFPESDNVDEFWDLLLSGEHAIKEVPSWRWVGDEDLADDPDVRKQKCGFLKCPVDDFDANFFNFLQFEAEDSDPQLRLLLEVTWESLENAGINPRKLRRTKTGVFCGVWRRDYDKILSKYRSKKQNKYLEDILTNTFSAIPAYIANQLGLTGPNIATESEFASSMISVHLACESLTSGESDMALVGGVNLILEPFTRNSIIATKLLSEDGTCNAFDAAADGFGRGEGCASIVLKRYPDAIKNGDRILAMIRGSAMIQDGTSLNLGIPTVECLEECMKTALKKSGVLANMVSYVEAHGASSLIRDKVEIDGIHAAYSNARKEPLWIGSVKNVVGNTESCAGLAGLVKVILALQNKTIPPHINFKNINPDINLKEIPVTFPRSAVEWKTDNHSQRIAGVNSFGMSGAIVHVIVQEAPRNMLHELSKQNEGDICRILTIGAKSDYSLKQLAKKYQQVLQKHPNALKHFIYTANVGRAKLTRRLAIIAKNAEEFVSSIEKESWLESKGLFSPASEVVFLFTGQGSNYPQMGKFLFQNNNLFRFHFEECSKIVAKHTKWSLNNLFMTNNYVEPQDELSYYQICILSIEYCLFKLWESAGVIPNIILGHSMGEFGAAVAAGILNIEDAIVLLLERCKLIEGLPNGKMFAVRAPKDEVEKLVESFEKANPSDWVDIAIVNSDSQIVVAGRDNAIQKFGHHCHNNAVVGIPIPSKRAFHSRDIKTILPKFDEALSKITFQNPKCKYISSNHGKLVTENEIDKEYWKRNSSLPVDFKKAFLTALQNGGRTFIEVGPQPILIGIGTPMVDSFISSDILWIPSMKRGHDELKVVLDGLSHLFVNGFPIEWNAFSHPDECRKISIPTYPFEHTKKYWVKKEESIPNKQF